jgi:membrane fusion protein (multidrug efflux system)
MRHLAAVLAVVAAAAASPALSAAAAEAGAVPAVPVEAAAVERAVLVDDVAAVGTLRSNESIVVRPEIAGRIAAIPAREGEAVERGQLLFSLDDAIAAAELRDAEVNLALSQRNYDRAQELYRRDAATQRSLDEAKARLDGDRARVELARAKFDKTRIQAPFAGILGLRHVSLGDFVAAGRDLINLEDIDPIKLDVRIPERYLAALQVGQPLAVSVDAYPERVFDGAIHAIDPLVDAAGRSVAVRATLANRDSLLRPGMFARVRIVLARREQALRVPEQAIVPRGSEHFVFRIVDGKAVWTPVRLGRRLPGWVEVVGGLAEGEQVVIAGQIKLRDGAPVRVAQPAGA